MKSFLLLVFMFSLNLLAQNTDFSVRLGIGTDISGGLAWGGQINTTAFSADIPLELAIVVHGGFFTETSNNGFNEYIETTDLYVIASLANYLFFYTGQAGDLYYLAGTGFGVVYLYWMEKSDTDTSLGTLLPSGGSMQDLEITTAINISNFGMGYMITDEIDVRLEMPLLIFFSAEGYNRTIVPAFLLSAGMRF